MFNVIEDFYSQSDLGLVIAHFVNLPFDQTHRSRDWAVTHRLQAYSVHETSVFERSEHPLHPYSIFKKTFETKTNQKILYVETFLRKIKLSELKESAVYKKDRPHKDKETFDYAGLVYFNSNSILDGTKLYNDERDFDPTIIIGSKVNRCVYYDTQQPHSVPFDQRIDERWVQPFFIITNEQTLKKYKDLNET